jgi:hypothetical protein
MVNNHKKKCSTSLAIKGNANQTTLRFHLTAVKMAVINITNNKCSEDVRKKGDFCTLGGNVNYCNNYGKQ